MLNLVYFADPMCSWCYGFGPQLTMVIERERERQPVNLHLTMGGLRAYNTQIIDAASIEVLLDHWKHVHEATGLPFNDAALKTEGFIYDTEPACRAVVVVRHLDAAKALAYYHAVQQAFYAEGRDATQESVLAEVALACGIDDGAFLEAFRSEAIKGATRHDFALTQNVEVTGFPTLCVDIGQNLYLLTRGFTRAELIEAGLERLAAKPPRQ
jgi:putative protein-disulfide isomerase